MVMVGQDRRLREPLGWTRTGRAALAAVVTLALAAVVVLIVAIASGSHSRPGCISVTFASTVGGATMQRCGENARHDCQSPRSSPFTGNLDALRKACEGAGLPYASSAA